MGQAITATVAIAAIARAEPLVVYALAALLVTPVLSRWVVDPYRFLWRQVVSRAFGPPTETESALPHRFARVVGAVVTTLASVALLLAGATGVSALALAGFALVGIVAVLAALGAVTGFCLGCRTYRSVARLQSLGVLTSPADGLGTTR